MPDLPIKGELPGEGLVKSVLDFVSCTRESMSEENRNKWDAAGYKLFKAWHNWWVTQGWPGEKLD